MKAWKIYIHDIVQEKKTSCKIFSFPMLDIKTSALDWPVSHQSSQLLSTNDMKKKNTEDGKKILSWCGSSEVFFALEKDKQIWHFINWQLSQ